MKPPYFKRIAANATFNVSPIACAIKQITFLCTNAGTTWLFRIQDKSAVNPLILLGPITLAVPTDGKPVIISFDQPIYLFGGCDIITPSGTPGVLNIWINFADTSAK